MIPPVIQAKIYSTLGNPSSLAPLALKDVTNSVGLTAGSFITGKEEGADRFIDEFGTEVLWLLGIPTFKGIINLTTFLPNKLDYNFDARNFRHKELTEMVREYAPEELKGKIDKVIAKEGLYKKLATSKFGVSVALAIATYIGLTKFKQKYTDKNIRGNILEEYAETQKAKMNEKQPAKSTETSTPSFTGIGKTIQDFACDPVKNMWLLDGGITTERIVDSRGPQERIGYVFKEGSFLFFMYYFGDKLQELLENRAKRVYNKTIGFDMRVLENPEFQKAFETNSIANDLAAFENLINPNIDNCKDKALKQEMMKAEEIAVKKFIYTNKDNFVVKTAMESDIVKPYKKWKNNIGLKDILTFSLKENTGEIDTRKYIEMSKFRTHYQNLQALAEEYKSKGGESSKQFFATVKRLKKGAIINNIGGSILVLGVITPTIMVLKRLLSPGDKEFCRKKEIREEMIRNGEILA